MKKVASFLKKIVSYAGVAIVIVDILAYSADKFEKISFGSDKSDKE